jgi:uroporphyrinogen-III synthase
MSGGLAGVRVLVTRPAEQARALARMIEAEGGVAIVSPALAIEPVADAAGVRDAIGAVARFDIAVFVSTNAVAHGSLLLAGVRGEGPRIAAIGPSTARALEGAGLRVSIRPRAGYTSEALLDEPDLRSLQGRRVLIVRGRGGRELLAETLAARGAEVVHAEVYERRPAAVDARALTARWKREGIDLVTALSVETLDALLAQLGSAARELLARTPLVTASARVIKRAEALGLPDAVHAAGPDDRALIEAMIGWARARGVRK